MKKTLLLLAMLCASLTTGYAADPAEEDLPDLPSIIDISGPRLARVGSPIKLKAFSLTNTKQASYQWSLEGLKGDLKDAKSPEVTFTPKEPGKAIIRVQTEDKEGRKSSMSTMIRVEKAGKPHVGLSKAKLEMLKKARERELEGARKALEKK